MTFIADPLYSIIDTTGEAGQHHEQPARPAGAKPMMQHSEVMIAGQNVSLVGKSVRGPLCLLARITTGGWSGRSQVVAHRWQTCSESGWWHEATFKTLREARTAFDTLASHKAALPLAEYMRRCRGELA